MTLALIRASGIIQRKDHCPHSSLKPHPTPVRWGFRHFRGWAVAQTVHVLPVGDLIAHEAEGDDCPCGPRVEPVPADNGSIGWLVVHSSLDGREQRETHQ